MSLALAGLAVALPRKSIEQSAAAAIAETFLGGQRDGNTLRALFRRSHIRARGSVLLEEASGCEPRQSFYWRAAGPDDHGPSTASRMRRYAEESLPLAAEASSRALHDAGARPDEITHLITVSCTGFFAPGIDIGLVKQLDLRPTVARLHVGFMGCHGVLNALRAAQAIVDADASAIVLICAVELCSLHYQYGGEADKLVANALFADGAAALVGRSAAESQLPWRVVSFASFLVPDAEDGMTWRIGDHGFEMTLSPRVPDLIGRHVRPWLESWLTAVGRRMQDIGSWAIHPGGPRILTSVAAATSLPDIAIAPVGRKSWPKCGNMSSPTFVFILERLMRQAAARPCVMLGFGPGLVAEAALLE